MLRLSPWLRRSLPFEPMALSTLDTLEERLRALGARLTDQQCAPYYRATTHRSTIQETYTNTSNDQGDVVEQMAGRMQWCTGQTPFFVSPKLDGVRLITYNTPASTHAAGKRARSDDTHSVVSQWTCYTRYGRALYGMFWLEEELRLLRALCGDPALVLDGELYLHRPANSHTQAACRDDNEEEEGGGGGCCVASTAPCADAFKTGFLAVSALVHRMRGSSSQCATVEDILQYVRALPQYYVFDVASYQPAGHLLALTCTTGKGGGAARGRRSALRPALSSLFARTFAHPAQANTATTTMTTMSAVGDAQEALLCEAELQRVWWAALRRCGVESVDTMRVLPNVTPFSARLRTMHFLYTLLQLGRRSPLLRRCFLAQGTPKRSHGTERPDMALRNAIAPHRKDKGYVHMVPYRLAHSLQDAQQRHLAQYIQDGFEGAVIRSPGNVYEMREKKHDTVRRLVQPQQHVLSKMQRCAAMQTAPIVRLYAHEQSAQDTTSGGNKRVRAGQRSTKARLSAKAMEKEEEEEEEDERRIAEEAVGHVRALPKRCENAVKLLPYRDQEYAILRPLLKEPSSNPRTRQLVLIPRDRLMKGKGAAHKILRTAASRPRNGTSETCKGETSCEAVKKKSSGDVVAFYGLHCLAENGRSFCVSLPKMSLERQRALLEHLLSVAGKRKVNSNSKNKNKNKKTGSASLTGLYATVKFAALTEHGVPRFGTVKAIRGGKGWFL